MRSAARRAIGILPGGTGNGFAREMGVPGTLREATEVLCRSTGVRSIDVGRLLEVGNVDVPDRYFIQRLYVGVEPEEQTSREMKDRYGVFAYAVNMAQRGSGDARSRTAPRWTASRREFQASRVYVVNSGMMGTGLRITHGYAVDDGLLDAFAIDGQRRHDGRGGVAIPRPAHRERVPVPPPVPDAPHRDRRRTSPSGPTASTSGGRRSASRSLPRALSVVVP